VLGLTLPIRRCGNPAGEFYHRPYCPDSEGRLALPHQAFGVEVIAWSGAQRYQAAYSLPESHRELWVQGVVVAARTVAQLLARYEEVVSVALQAPARRAALRQPGCLILALEGLQPDKGHARLWVVREVLSGDILIARRLLASGQEDRRGLRREAVVGLEGVPIKGVISDGQRAVCQAVATVLPGVAHQLCQFHSLRAAGRPSWETDRQAQKEFRQRVRGGRAIKRQGEERTDPEAAITREYCAAVRGARSDMGPPPLAAGGLQLQQRLSLIEASLTRGVPNRGDLRR